MFIAGVQSLVRCCLSVVAQHAVLQELTVTLGLSLWRMSTAAHESRSNLPTPAEICFV